MNLRTLVYVVIPVYGVWPFVSTCLASRGSEVFVLEAMLSLAPVKEKADTIHPFVGDSSPLGFLQNHPTTGSLDKDTPTQRKGIASTFTL